MRAGPVPRRRDRPAALAACALALAGCAGPGPAPVGTAAAPAGRYFDPLLGVWASPRLVEDGESVPRGGGGYLVGRPYTIGGRSYAPLADPRGYAAVGTASWYGGAFHGRRTANGEIFDKGSISAAHPTLPLPSYVRVTNLGNDRSIVVRVNDRGPYHGGRVMDVSERVADALAFRGQGTGRVRIEYLGRAGLEGADDGRLLATLTTDGRPAQLERGAALADAGLPPRPDGPSPLPNVPAAVAALPVFSDPPTARRRAAAGADPFFRPLGAPAPRGPRHGARRAAPRAAPPAAPASPDDPAGSAAPAPVEMP